jgi:hypothetical protein
MRTRILLALLLASLSFPARPAGRAIQPAQTSVTYGAKAGPGQGRHVVFLSGDEEYRSEEALPMLAKILSQRHGFKTTVLFSVDPDGTINPKNTKSLSNSAALDTADVVVMSLRFRAWPDEDMARFEKFLRSGKPIVALRTSTHAFNGFPRGSQWEHGTTTSRADWKTGARRNVADALGTAQDQATRGAIEPAGREHPVLRSVAICSATRTSTKRIRRPTPILAAASSQGHDI